MALSSLSATQNTFNQEILLYQSWKEAKCSTSYHFYYAPEVPIKSYLSYFRVWMDASSLFLSCDRSLWTSHILLLLFFIRVNATVLTVLDKHTMRQSLIPFSSPLLPNTRHHQHVPVPCRILTCQRRILPMNFAILCSFWNSLSPGTYISSQIVSTSLCSSVVFKSMCSYNPFQAKFLYLYFP